MAGAVALSLAEALAAIALLQYIAPGCPVAGEMPGFVRDAGMKGDGVTACDVKLVWEPKWDKSMLSEAVRLELGLF